MIPAERLRIGDPIPRDPNPYTWHDCCHHCDCPDSNRIGHDTPCVDGCDNQPNGAVA